MKRQIITWVGMCCISAAICGLLAEGAAAQAGEVPAKQAAEAKALTGRFVTTVVQRVGERSYTGILLALPEGAGLVTVYIAPGEQTAGLIETAKQLESGQLVRVEYDVRDENKWVRELMRVEAGQSKAEGQNAEAAPASKDQADGGEAVSADKQGLDGLKPEQKPDEFADADSRARAKIRQLEQRVAELEAEVRKLREAAAAPAKTDAPAKDKADPKLMTGTTEGRVGTLIQRNVDGKSLPAVVVSTDGVLTVLVVPQVENDKGEKTYDPAVRTVVESLKQGQQVKVVWQTDGKEKMIKSIEVVPEITNWPDRPRRRGF